MKGNFTILLTAMTVLAMLAIPARRVNAASMINVSPICNFKYTVDQVNLGRAHHNESGESGKAVDIFGNEGSGSYGQYQTCYGDGAYAGFDGIVDYVQMNHPTCGNFIQLKRTDSDGSIIKIQYCHLQEFFLLGSNGTKITSGLIGRSVKAGDRVGTIGRTGHVEGNGIHIHFTVRRNSLLQSYSQWQFVNGISTNQNYQSPIPSDFDGDGKTDIATFRQSNATRYITQSTNGYKEIGFGSTTDIPVHGGDYDGDGKSDAAVFRPSSGKWYLSQSTAGYKEVGFGSTTDVPINGGDFDGDGKTDIAVFRKSNATRYILQSRDGYRELGFGSTTDIPVHGGDYDGDGKADVAVYRANEGKWFLMQSTAGYKEVFYGSQTDTPINGGDFDGDGKTDIALFRSSNPSRQIKLSGGGYREIQFGSLIDIPVHGGDYDGDGKADVAVYRANEGKWFLLQSTAGYKEFGFGSQSDLPI